MTRYILPVLFFLFLAGATYVIKERRAGLVAEAAPSHAAAAPATAREAWAVAFLAALGNAQPTPATVAMVVAWTLAEDSGDGAFERNNPLNTTICGHNFVGAINADGACGVGHYATYQDGVSAAVDTITQANFSAIVAALQANDTDGAKQALWASAWAESHYGYGSAWPVYRAAAAKCLPTATGAISAHFNDTNSGYWSAYAGKRHNGTDYSGSQGDPVVAPFAFVVEDIQYYGDAGRLGWYVQGRFSDGYLFYAGHLGTVAVTLGQAVPACAVVGTIGDLLHTHIKINRPGSPEPCEATGCDDFEVYYKEH